jgi:UDP-N-acetylglucosamine--N-acetylmuramyl-(pentapeptide) pyrophosphoryl-undecaprenol N-acetylglucosamine transferase
MHKTKILLTGGHLSPVLAILPQLNKLKYHIVFLGRQSAFNKVKKPGLEYQILHQHPGLQFYTFSSGRFTRGELASLPKELFMFLKALFRAYHILSQEKPDLVFSFGGYLSLPVCLAAKFKGIKVRLHEQTVRPGKANRLIAGLAEKIFVTFPQSRLFFPKEKTEVSGIPIRAECSIKKKVFGFKRLHRPLILIMGGSSGSHSLNLLIEKLLPNLTNKYQLIHQIGDNQYNDYKRLKKLSGASYQPLRYLFPEQIGHLYQEADLIVCRSGANTFFELIKIKKPAVLLPLPWSANDEQLFQAKILEKKGVAYIFNQKETSLHFLSLLEKAIKNQKKLKKNYQNLEEYAQLIKKPDQFLTKVLS